MITTNTPKFITVRYSKHYCERKYH